MKKVAALIIAMSVIFTACQVGLGKSKAKEQEKIKKMVVGRGSITVKLEETGDIQPIRKIDLKSRVSGKVVKFQVEEGDNVNIDDVIAEIEPDYNEAEKLSNVKSNLELAEINLKNAKKDLADNQKLFEGNYISENQLQVYKDNLRKAQINYNDAAQQYELIKDIETEDMVSKLRATASGTVIQKLVEEGEMVISSAGTYAGGTVIVKLADLNRMVVKSRINEVDISKVKKDQKVNIQVDAYPYEKYEGTITKIAAMAIEYNNVKVFPIEIEIDNVDDKLKPGMTANITIIGEEKSEIVVVPIRTIFSDEEGNDVVYKVQNDTISGSVYVKTGINNFQNVEIIEGLSEGDTISFTEPIREEKKVEFRLD